MRACNCARASPLQSRTRVGCDSMRNTFDIVSSQFQSTHPRGVRRRAAHQFAHAGIGFNPRTRVGCDAFRQVGTKSLTGFNPRTRVGCDVTGFLLLFGIALGFNPRTRVGCDDRSQGVGGRPSCVSIHAPAWGATGPSLQQSAILQSFNPRTRVGCDPTTPAVWWPSSSFNPRTRVGCDVILLLRTLLVVLGFNPRTRVGCDSKGDGFYLGGFLFQSTHPRGVRLKLPLDVGIIGKFQSTHPRGVRLPYLLIRRRA